MSTIILATPPVTNEIPTVVFSNAPKIVNRLPDSTSASPPVFSIIVTVPIINAKIGRTKSRTPASEEPCCSEDFSSWLIALRSKRAIEPISNEK